jgi:hypothetical protein
MIVSFLIQQHQSWGIFMSEQFGYCLWGPIDFSVSFLCSLKWKILVRRLYWVLKPQELYFYPTWGNLPWFADPWFRGLSNKRAHVVETYTAPQCLAVTYITDLTIIRMISYVPSIQFLLKLNTFIMFSFYNIFSSSDKYFKLTPHFCYDSPTLANIYNFLGWKITCNL